jgi:hypothetical protein
VSVLIALTFGHVRRSGPASTYRPNTSAVANKPGTSLPPSRQSSWMARSERAHAARCPSVSDNAARATRGARARAQVRPGSLFADR